MDEREKIISSRLKEIENKKIEAEQEAESYRNKEQQLIDMRDEMIAKVREEIDDAREELTKKALQEVEENKTEWFESINRQKNSFLNDLRYQITKEVCEISHHVLHDLANEKLERQIINTFIRRLEKPDEDEKEAIKELKLNPQQEFVIKSAFEIPQDMRQSILKVIQEHISEEAKVLFKISPDIICGIELNTIEKKISWNLDSYLEALKEDITGAFEKGVQKGTCMEEENQAGNSLKGI